MQQSAGRATLRPIETSPPPLLPIASVGDVYLDAMGEDFAALGRLLQQLNHRVVWAGADGPPAVEPGQSTGVVVVSDAIEDALDRCRRWAETRPVILISDDASLPFRIAVARAGVSAIVGRPVGASELSEWFSYLAFCEASAQVSVLIVDDDRFVSEINADILRSAGMSVSITHDPARTLEMIDQCCPDLVLMDVRMPGMDGVELAQVIRQSMHLIALPIVFLSAEQDERRQLVARRLGGDDFIIKPISPDRLISLVRMRAERSKVLRSLIERDRLTGLLDHTRFKERLFHAWERSRRTGSELSLAMIDIDRFKDVNDSYGHAVGDDVLRTLSDLLVSGVRKMDIVGRYGGEEFGVIMIDTAPEDAARILTVLKDRLRAISFRARGPERFSVSFSAGVASSRWSQDATDLISRADALLYSAKSDGRNIVRSARDVTSREAGGGLTREA